MECNGCVYDYYEPDCNYRECTHPGYNIEEPDDCPGEYSIADAKATNRKEKDNG